MTLRPKSLALAVCISLIFALAATAAPLRAAGSAPYSLTVLVNGVAAPEYSSRGRVYIEALKGRNFSLLLANRTAERVAVALSVDGRNVIDAKRTSAGAASKWILAPWQTTEIPGWQISGSVARQFFFTETRRSYAKWLGDTSNAGTIEAVFYRERRPVVAAAPPSPPIAYDRPWRENGADERARKEQQAPPEARADAGSIDGNAGAGGAPHSTSEQVTVSGDSPVIDSRAASQAQAPEPGPDKDARSRPMNAPSSAMKPSDTFAATGIGARTSFDIEWVRFDEDPNPAARVALRYEFRAELVRLGVLRSEDDLYARDRGRGFEREYAPDPYRDR